MIYTSLCGPSVRLRPLAFEHAAALLVAATEDRSSYGFTRVPDNERAMDDYIAEALEETNRGTVLAFVVIHDGEVVGTTRFLDIDFWSKESPLELDAAGRSPRAVEIGSTWFATSSQRTVVNTETKFLMLRHAFEVWEVERVSFKTDARNLRSRRAIERIGATPEGIRRAHLLATDGTIRDSAYFSILRSEWPSVKERLSTLLS